MSTRQPTSQPAHGSQRMLQIIGWIATCTGLLMFVSYIDQIHLNINGEKGSKIQPLMTVINCSLWVAYGGLRQKADWPIILANAPGVIFGAVALYTAF